MTNETGTESLDSYHGRNCKICRHEDRAAIEFDYLQWRSPEYIAKEYSFSHRALYRHVHALGLTQKRRLNLRASLELAIEGMGKAPPTIEGVLKAVQLYARMNESGEIVEVPKTQVIVISKEGSQTAIPALSGIRIDQPAIGPGEAAASLLASGEQITNLDDENYILQPVNPSQTDFELSQ